jgi:deazaflavin-dependent oxidoreductase (nitroreductase family)
MARLDGVTDPALRPTRLVALLRRAAGPAWRAVGIAAVLEVSGRRSGKTHRVNVIPVDLDGRTYVLSFGGITEWSRNLRAAPRGHLQRRRRKWAFTAVEVSGDERERVISRYLAGTGPLKNDFNRKPDPAEHPTFRLDPAQ